jgi:hypothetical protein
MTDQTTAPAGVVSSNELGGLPPNRAAFEAWCSQQGWAESDLADKCAEGAPRAGEYRDVSMQAVWEIWQAAVAAERERWQEVAQAVIRSHDAALAYVYESLKAQGVGSITIPDAAVAEIRAVNALRELVQPNTEAQRAAVGGPTGAQS